MRLVRENDNGLIREYQMTGMRCRKCNTPFQSKMEVNIPIDQYVKQMRSIKCPSCGSKELTLGLNLSLSEDRGMRKNLERIEDRLQEWLDNGEIGLSSLYLASVLSGDATIAKEAAYPHDYDDLRRSLLLLDRIPEWKNEMFRMARKEGWEKIANRWPEIEAAILEADTEALNPTSAESVLKTIFKR